MFPTRGAGTALARLAPNDPPKRLLEPLTAKVQDPSDLESKGIPVFSYPLQLFFDMARQDVNLITALNAMAAYALCYRCLMYRAEKLVEAPLWIVDETPNDGEVWLPSTAAHPLTKLLEQPNPDMEMQEFLLLLSLYLDIEGAALAVMNRTNGGDVGTMYPFSRREFSVEPTLNPPRLYGKFQVSTYTSYEVKSAEDVIYFRMHDPRNLYQQLSPTDVALSHVNLGRDMMDAIKSALRNATRPGGIVTVTGELGDGAFKRMKQEIMTNYRGVFKAGETILLEGGAEWKEAKGGTLKEMALGPLQEDVEAGICSAYGIHPILVGAKVGVQANSGLGDSVKPLTDKYYDDVAFPRWGYFERALTRGLLRPVDPRVNRFLRFDRTKVRALQPDMGARVTEAASAASFWLIDEQRAHTGKKPLPNKEGQILGPDKVAKQQADAAEQAARNLQHSQSTQAPPKKTLGEESLGAGSETKVATVFLGKSRIHITPELITKAWEAFDTKAKADEPEYEREALEQFAAEADGVARIILESVPTSKAIDDESVASSILDPYIRAAELRIAALYSTAGRYYKQWIGRYKSLIASTFGGAANDLAGQVGFDFTLRSPLAEAAIQRRVTKLAGNIAETTIQKIRDILEQGRADGIGVRELANRIRSDAFGGDVSKTRATTIARTETVGALNEGEMIAARQSGILKSKRWIDQQGETARDDHVEEQTKGFVALGDPYPVTGKQYPHDGIGGAEQDVNCRCSQMFSDLDPDAANATEEPNDA